MKYLWDCQNIDTVTTLSQNTRVYEQLDQTVAFSSIQAEIPMEEIYSGINFESQKSN